MDKRETPTQPASKQAEAVCTAMTAMLVTQSAKMFGEVDLTWMAEFVANKQVYRVMVGGSERFMYCCGNGNTSWAAWPMTRRTVGHRPNFSLSAFLL